MPNIDPANPGPWLASLQRLAAPPRRGRARRRRQRAGRGGGAALLAAMTLVAGGAVAADGPRLQRRAAAVLERVRHVVALQRALGVAADGVYRPVTRRAVRNFQRTHGLAVDGIAGPATLGSARHRGLDARRPRRAAGPRRRLGHARADRAVRVGRQPDRGLVRRPATAASTSSPAPPGASSAAPAIPAAAPESVQDAMAAKLLAQRGTSPWPVCG